MTPHLVFTECLLLEKLLKEGQGEQTLNINMVYRRAMARILMLIIKAKMVMMTIPYSLGQSMLIMRISKVGIPTCEKRRIRSPTAKLSSKIPRKTCQ